MKIHLILSTKWISENIFQKMNICGYLCTKWILKSIPEKLNSSCYPKHRDSIIQVIVCWLQERGSGDKLSRALQKVHHLLIHTSCTTCPRKSLEKFTLAAPCVPETRICFKLIQRSINPIYYVQIVKFNIVKTHQIHACCHELMIDYTTWKDWQGNSYSFYFTNSTASPESRSISIAGGVNLNLRSSQDLQHLLCNLNKHALVFAYFHIWPFL